MDYINFNAEGMNGCAEKKNNIFCSTFYPKMTQKEKCSQEKAQDEDDEEYEDEDDEDEDAIQCNAMSREGGGQKAWKFCAVILRALSLVEWVNKRRRIMPFVDALFDALNSVDSATGLEPSVPDGAIVSSQVANAESKKLQFTGDVLEVATQFLVKKYGVGILTDANEVLAELSAPESASFLSQLRTKRQSSSDYSNPPSGQVCQGPPKSCFDPVHDRIRSITGYCNNRDKATQANAVTPIRRLLGTTSYSDSLQAIRNASVTGSPLPSTRLISNKLHDEGSTPNFSPSVNHLHMQIGQFIAHDIIFMPSSVAKDGSNLNCTSCSSPTTVSTNCAPIPAPSDDKYFTPVSKTEARCIRLTRALNGQSGFGVRTQIDQNTHYLDMSVVYGSSDCEAQNVRSFSNGLLKTYTGMGYALPPQTKNDTNCQSKNPYYCFTVGDFRNCLHPGLLPLHTVFIKEHNRLAVKVKSARSSWNDEQIYQFVRSIMVAQWQHIVYNEYLPKLLSDKYLTDFKLKTMKPGSGSFRGYDTGMNAALSGEFAAAAFRFGHSQSRQDFARQDATNKSLGAYDLGYNIFYSDQVYQKSLGGTETMLMGLIKTAAMQVDRYFSFPIRNQLFEIRGQNASGVDLIAVNIMRGRDVGLLPYVKYRDIVGLPKVQNWNDLASTFTAGNIAALKTVYADPADIDLYSGLVMETPISGGQLGPTASWIVAEQFRALKTGDRFYYENQVQNTVGFTQDQIDAIRRVKLAKIFCENTDIITNINVDVFDLNSNQVSCSSIPDIDLKWFL
uniref:Peroxidase n=1 Tax=Caenorhabditis japonica TaxID=281687 RepID=A0A8R1HSM5_CAEJA